MLLEEHLARKKRRKTIGCLVVPLIVLLLLGGAFFAFRIYCAGRVQAEIDAIADARYPVTLEELNAWHHEPVGKNAADTYLRAFAKYVRPSEELARKLPILGLGQRPPTREPLPDEMRAAIAQHLEANKKAFELLHEAAGIEECRYPVDMTDGHAVLLPHLDKTNHIARLLRLEALHHAQRGEGEQAADSMAALLGLGRSLANEPILISYLVEHACDTRAVKSLEETLSIIALPEGQIVEPAAALEQAENAEAMRRAFVGEACSMHGAFQKAAGELGAYRGVPGIPRPLTVLYSTTGLLDLDDAACLKIMRDVIEASEKPLIERLQAMRSIDVEKRVENLPSYCILTKTLMPESEHAGEEDARHAAQLRAARTALAVERYRRTRGPLPQKLDDLVPEFMDAIPIDPFDGKPMRYNKLERGYVVYCIGPDGDDDGGKEREPGGGDDHDVPFTVAR